MIQSHLLKNLSGYIDGRWADASSPKTFDVRNPANGELLATLPDMGAAETHAAAEAADRAWKKLPPVETRKQWLMEIHDALLREKQELARIITLEQGKPLKESLAEIDYSAGFFKFFASQIHHLAPSPLNEKIRGASWKVHHRPAGVVGLITPWNFPLAMLAKKFPAALAAGCGIVTKPADLTPLTTIALWHILDEVRIPAGIANLVIGDAASIGDVLCTHPAVRMISFTGSTEVGRLLIRNTAPHVKRLSLELGGNAPYIVTEDADLTAAADALMANKFRCAGQTCVCANRILVHATIADQFAEEMARRVKDLRVGGGLSADTDIGPLINAKAVDKVRRHVEDALEKGARNVAQAASPKTGTFYPPTVLDHLASNSVMLQEETFGPVVAISRFANEEEAIDLANSTIFGLAAYLFTRDDDRIERMLSQLRFGHVGVNTGMGPTPEAPFGGMKQSGFGREGGLEGLLEYCEPQTVAAM